MFSVTWHNLAVWVFARPSKLQYKKQVFSAAAGDVQNGRWPPPVSVFLLGDPMDLSFISEEWAKFLGESGSWFVRFVYIFLSWNAVQVRFVLIREVEDLKYPFHRSVAFHSYAALWKWYGFWWFLVVAVLSYQLKPINITAEDSLARHFLLLGNHDVWPFLASWGFFACRLLDWKGVRLINGNSFMQCSKSKTWQMTWGLVLGWTNSIMMFRCQTWPLECSWQDVCCTAVAVWWNTMRIKERKLLIYLFWCLLIRRDELDSVCNWRCTVGRRWLLQTSNDSRFRIFATMMVGWSLSTDSHPQFRLAKEEQGRSLNHCMSWGRLVTETEATLSWWECPWRVKKAWWCDLFWFRAIPCTVPVNHRHTVDHDPVIFFSAFSAVFHYWDDFERFSNTWSCGWHQTK